jgi:multisubunit Na+/H+ antiporter MnhG subunit
MPITSAKLPFDFQFPSIVGFLMLVRPTIYELARSRRAVVLTPLVIVLNAVLIWTLAHTDIAAFATVFIAGVVLVFGTFWATGPVSSRRIANLSHSAGRSSDYGAEGMTSRQRDAKAAGFWMLLP